MLYIVHNMYITHVKHIVYIQHTVHVMQNICIMHIMHITFLWIEVKWAFTVSSSSNRCKIFTYQTFSAYDSYLTYMLVNHHILHIMNNELSYDQNRVRLDTQHILQSKNNQGHIYVYSTLLMHDNFMLGIQIIRGKCKLSWWLFVWKMLQQTNFPMWWRGIAPVWWRQGQYLSTCKERQQTVLDLPVKKTLDGGDGWFINSWHCYGEQSSSGNKG